MDSSPYGFMKLGIVLFKAFPEIEFGSGSYLEALRRIAADDFWTAVEVGWMKDVRIRNEARRIIEESHLDVYYATQPAILSQKLNLNSFDPLERKKAVAAVRNGIEEAYFLGARWVRVLSGKDPGPEKREEAKKLLTDSLHQICDYAVSWGANITLKIFDRDVDKQALVGPFAEAAAVARDVKRDHDNFGLLVDLSHFPLLREKPEEAIPLVRQYFVHSHIGNCVVRDRKHPAYGDLQPRFGVEGGEIDVGEVSQYFRLLLDIGFLNQKDRPAVSVEVRPMLAGETSELTIANAKRVIKEAWALA
ncbi:MAG: sugar phosphate isomerase/epimerase [Firmicutes bacterium]|nr:sugar phosphate isomerase/epimerase [Bacillota bacterium]MCL5040329.1 sugar phosphate isomerase/epimerase [Bacillota bacterium]